MDHTVLLRAENIEKAFGENIVLTNAGLEVRKGEVMALLGENGAGKSTLVKIITGVYKRDGGTITLDGERMPDEYDKEYAERKGISIIYQWLARKLKVLIVDEPTAGVDVGAKDEIYNIMKQICEQGVAIILVSSDLPEIVRLSNRILVMRNGKIIKEFNEGYVTEEDILKASSGFVEEEEVAQ